MDFNDRATGDAALLVVITWVLVTLGTRGVDIISALLSPVALVTALLSTLFLWLIYSGAIYGISRYLLDGHGTFAVFLRIVGFAAPTLIVVVFPYQFLGWSFLTLLIGGAWFVVVVANGLTYVADIALQKAFVAAIGGYVAIVVVQSIFSGISVF